MTKIETFLEAVERDDWPDSIASDARNAAPEIAELVEWVRKVTAKDEYGNTRTIGHLNCHGSPCKCGLDRVRELVGGEG